MTAPVRPLTMRDVLRAYALGERMNDWVLASRAVSHLVPQGSPNYDLCAEMCRLHASTCENDFIGLAEHIVNDATLARLAEVERERDEARNNAALYNRDMMKVREQRDAIREMLAASEKIRGDLLLIPNKYEMRTKEAPDSPPRSLFWELDAGIALGEARIAIAAAEQRLARLRPLVRAVILWERLRGDVGEMEARIVMLNIIRNHFDPTDRAWATEEER